ncbi:MAG: type I methionyl aminopeptidase [Candidatus Lindowbacteria bacterium]|nr:type I methionyl aminopeptidase [Candidatus Lindowbacteria bacterium]
MPGSGIELKSVSEIDLMRQANQIVVAVHKELQGLVKPGVTTMGLDKKAATVIAMHSGATPAFLGYHGFPGVICASVDEQVVHGIPSDEIVLHEGAIISIDVGVKFRGFIGDAAVTYSVGKVDDDAQKLLIATRESLYKAIEQAHVGNRLSDIGHAVESYVVPRGYGVVTEYVGHGVGRQMHEEPQVANFGPPHRGPKIVAGMTLAIEPMINEGTGKTRVLEDEWTVITEDGRRSAHFEHSIAITENGPIILSDGLPDGLGN